MTWHKVASEDTTSADRGVDHGDRYAKAVADRAEAVTMLIRVVVVLILWLIPIGVIVALGWAIAKAVRAMM